MIVVNAQQGKPVVSVVTVDMDQVLQSLLHLIIHLYMKDFAARVQLASLQKPESLLKMDSTKQWKN